MFKIAVDVGGTFTDIVLLEEESGTLSTFKVETTPHDLSIGFTQGVGRATPDLSAVRSISHGTTVALNAILTRSGAKTGLLCTEGWRDVVDWGRAGRPQRVQWDPEWVRSFSDASQPLVPRYLRRGVRERVLSDGSILFPLDVEQAKREIEFLKKLGVEAVAVCLLNSYINGEHEKALMKLAKELLPDCHLCASHDTNPTFKEYYRWSTCVINAYTMPAVKKYLDNAREKLRYAGYKHELYLMQSNGGIMASELLMDKPCRLVGSGPAGGVVGAVFIGKLIGTSNLITMDVGGTSCDVSAVTSLEVPFASEMEVEPDLFIALPSVDVKSIGAGGGSIAWIDTGGALRVGPQSAGATPGPACYGRGGTKPTVSDAHLTRGTLFEDFFLGGEMRLYRELSQKALEPLATHFNYGTTELASAVIDILDANMAEAIREISVYRGLDPRDYALLTFGSAGPMHATAVAKQLEIKHVIVPPFPGEMCAFGLLTVDAKTDASEALVKPLDEIGGETLTAVYQRLEEKAIKTLVDQGVPADHVTTVRLFDGRYTGQTWDTMSVPVPSGRIDNEGIERMKRSFHDAHMKAWGYNMPLFAVKATLARVSAFGEIRKPKLRRLPEGGKKPEDTALIRHEKAFVGNEKVSLPLFDRAKLSAGNVVDGPAGIVQKTATTILLHGDEASVDEFGNLLITVGGM